jgi:hypothetical protein
MRKDPQQRTNRAQGIAIPSSLIDCKENNQNQEGK